MEGCEEGKRWGGFLCGYFSVRLSGGIRSPTSPASSTGWEMQVWWWVRQLPLSGSKLSDLKSLLILRIGAKLWGCQSEFFQHGQTPRQHKCKGFPGNPDGTSPLQKTLRQFCQVAWLSCHLSEAKKFGKGDGDAVSELLQNCGRLCSCLRLLTLQQTTRSRRIHLVRSWVGQRVSITQYSALCPLNAWAEQQTERCGITQGLTRYLQQQGHIAIPPVMPSQSKPDLLKPTVTHTSAQLQASNTVLHCVNTPEHLESA